MPGKITLVQTTKEPVHSDDIMNSIKNADPFHYPIDVPADEQYIFNSFCVDEERTKLGVEMPLEENPYAMLSSLVLDYVEDPDSGIKNVKKTTPEVRKSDKTNIPMTAYEYSMYTYKIAPKPAQLSDDKRRWVFTGGGKLAIGLITNTFIPVDQLQIRLNGTAQQRRIAYAYDWMTYLAYWSALGGLFKPKIPTDLNIDLASLLPNGYTAKQIFTGAHLGVRNSIGELADGSKFLGGLLEPPGNDPIDDLSVFIFTRWCKVAYAACIAEPAAWSVKARFWAWPQLLDNKVTFVYEMPKDMWLKVSEAKANKAVAEKLGTTTISKIEQQELSVAWKAAIKEAHEAAKWQAGDPKDGNTVKAVPSPMCKTMVEVSNLKDYVFLASHPQGFYEIYVSQKDLEAMEERGYVYNKALDFPTQAAVNPILATNVTTLKATDEPAFKTKTLISTSTLAAATLWPRFETQNKVMNYSANTAAQDIWSKTAINNGSFEWLHRSAYSYGGIDKDGPDSSQVAYNMVLGTYEANTAMIRHEEYLKRFVRYKKTADFRLFLFTTLNTQTAWGDDTWSWLIKDLIYEWEFLLFKDPSFVVRTKHSFPVLSRQIPSRFEFDVDEQFDDMWMSETVAASKQNFKIGMLLYLAGGADTKPLTWNP